MNRTWVFHEEPCACRACRREIDKTVSRVLQSVAFFSAVSKVTEQFVFKFQGNFYKLKNEGMTSCFASSTSI